MSFLFSQIFRRNSCGVEAALGDGSAVCYPSPRVLALYAIASYAAQHAVAFHRARIGDVDKAVGMVGVINLSRNAAE
jgi:hypothetical protein